MILRMWKDTKLAWFGKPSRIYLYTFILVSWNHTCGLELDIFFFGWDIFILPIVAHTNLTNVPQITAAILISWRHFGIGLLRDSFYFWSSLWNWAGRIRATTFLFKIQEGALHFHCSSWSFTGVEFVCNTVDHLLSKPMFRKLNCSDQ